MTTEPTQKIQPPGPIDFNHNLESFSSTSEELNEWLRKRALKNEGSASRTYVVTIGQQEVIAYYCLAAASVTHNEATGKVRRNMPDPIPCIVLGRFAVDSKWTKQGIGTALFRDAILRILQVSEIVGVRAVLIHAKSEKAKEFYKKYGFKPSPISPMTLMTTLEDIRASL